MPIIKHLHTYRRHKTRPGYMMCIDPYCTHIIKMQLLEGKAALCNKCHGEMIISQEDLRRVRPVCLDCSNTKEARARRRTIEFQRRLTHRTPMPLPEDPLFEDASATGANQDEEKLEF